MTLQPQSIRDVLLITPRRFGDDRGWFCETYNRFKLAEQGLDLDFVQDNHSLSVPAGTVRGLHFQRPPHAQAKLIRVVRGAILDVAVDLRQGSRTFGQHVTARLDAAEGAQLLVPVGFAHGFATLEPDTEVIYKVTDRYAPDCDAGIRWNDQALGIDWGVQPDEATLSDKDAKLPPLSELDNPFRL